MPNKKDLLAGYLCMYLLRYATRLMYSSTDIETFGYRVVDEWYNLLHDVSSVSSETVSEFKRKLNKPRLK